MPKLRTTTPQVFQHQADATLSQNNPVSGTKYTVLDTTKNVRITGVSAKCTWTTQPTPLEIHLTIDGQAINFSLNNPVSATPYEPYFSKDTSDGYLTGSDFIYSRAFLVEGRSVKVEAEITGGTVSNLTARVKYAKIP